MSHFIILFSTVLVALVAMSNASEDKELWTAFKEKFGKIYRNSVEETLRYEIFQKNLRKIEVHNNKFENGQSTFEMGITEFSDLSSDEFRKYFGSQHVDLELPKTETFHENTEVTIPERLDWREKIGTKKTELRIMYYCAAYWAMSTMDAIESQVFLKHGRKVHLSEQELLECSNPYGNYGCSKGSNYKAAEYIIDHGVAHKENYPYKRYVEECKNETIPKSKITLKGYVKIPKDNETALLHALASVGPISVLFDDAWGQHYESGIIDFSWTQPNYWNNGGLLVGYGTENNTNYWIVQSYYGPQWGENGYFRIIRGKNDLGGIAFNAMYPIIV